MKTVGERLVEGLAARLARRLVLDAPQPGTDTDRTRGTRGQWLCLILGASGPCDPRRFLADSLHLSRWIQQPSNFKLLPAAASVEVLEVIAADQDGFRLQDGLVTVADAHR